MVCTNCKNRFFCKYYDMAINTHDIEIDVSSCNYYNSRSLCNNNGFTPISTTTPNIVPLKTGGVNETLFRSENITQPIPTSRLNSIEKLTTPINTTKTMCSKCGKQVDSTKVQACYDCGKMVCYDCGYTTINVNTGEALLTCNDCFDGTDKEGTVSPLEWDISSFNEEIIEAEVDANVKSRKTKFKKPNKNTEKA